MILRVCFNDKYIAIIHVYIVKFRQILRHESTTIFLAGEALVVCVVVSCPEPRPLRIRPKKRFRPLSPGDEEIEIVPSAGDAYDMDGVMQIGYEHSLPKKTMNSSHRFAIVL